MALMVTPVLKRATEAMFPHKAVLHIRVGDNTAGHPTHSGVQPLLLTCIPPSVSIRLRCRLKGEEDGA